MNAPGNWNPTGVPTGVVQVVFDSSIENVDVNPTQSGDNFSVCSILFSHSASPFTIYFNDHTVALNGLGITGLQTNATLNVTNTNNLTALDNQVSFNRNNPSSSGSAVLNIINTGSQLLNSSGVMLSNLDNQLFVQGPFSMLNEGSLTLTNIGSDSSHGTGGNQISYMTAYQAQMNNVNSIEDHVTISLSNSGTYSGSNSLTGNSIGVVLNGQYYNADSFFSGDALDFSVTNNGVNTGTSEGGSSIGAVGSSQISFGNTCNLGDSNSIAVSNYGENSGNSGTNGSNLLYVGNVYEHQFLVNTQFVAGDDLSLTATNVGIDSGSGSGLTYVGCITTIGSDGDQVMFNNSCTVGKQAAFVAQNSGTCSGNKTGAFTGVAQLNSNQMTFNGGFQGNDLLNFSITNSGTDSSDSINPNGVGTVSGSQLLFNSSTVLRNDSTIHVSNQGIFSGNTVNPISYAGVIGSAQFKAVSHFSSGDSFRLQVENTGEDTGSGAGNNLIGSVGAQQVYFQDACSLGDDADIVISNNGTNSNESTSNQTGYVNLSQLEVGGNFIAGTNLNISITNTATNTGDETNYIGYVSGSQALFNGTVTLGDGSVISTTNNGTVEGTQISFNEGFIVSSGKVTIQAINEGVRISDIGLFIQGANSGGNANIVLKDVMLDIETSLPSFTIGELNGDSTSVVQSIPSLMINTDSSTNGLFSGSIQDHLATPLLLTKQGPGIQTLSGVNTYTGLTSIQEGVLSINGSVPGDVTVNFGGTLKGSGTIGGGANIENGGVLSPGNSIGTINLGSLVLHSGSTTAIEINPTASSRVNVTGSALVDGVLQIIQDQGVFPRQGSYQILTAGSLNGVFSSINTIPGFTFDLSYLGNDIYLNYVLAIPVQGLHGNLQIVANYLNAEAPSSSGFMSLAALSGDELKQALTSVSPSRNAFGTYITAQTAFSLSRLVSSRIDGFRFSGKEFSQDHFLSALTADTTDRIANPARSKEPKNKFSAWISGFGEFAHQAASLENPSFNFISEAVLAGLDYQGENRGLAGGSLGYAHTHYYEENNAGHGHINYGFASVYGNYFIEDFYLSPAIWGLFNETDNTRNISFPGFSEKAHADIFVWQLVPHLEVGYDVEFCWGDMIPFTSLDWAISWQRSYQEHGASPFNAQQKANDSSMVRSEIGLKFCEKWDQSWGSFFLREKASYIFEKPFGTGTVNTSFVGTPSSFTVTAVNQNLNLGSVGLNFIAAIGKEKPVKVDFGYEGEFGFNYWSSELNITVSKDF
ncbi:MAG: autotransporter domain-containing protein [Chlamydiales bacterium]|nr:autotransporter domain-containing protein [Chlamydiales bacterium]